VAQKVQETFFMKINGSSKWIKVCAII
jgi:hypothetical protein